MSIIMKSTDTIIITITKGAKWKNTASVLFVYYRRPAFDIHKFDHFIATRWSRNIIRAKGVCYFSHNRDMSYLFEQAGTQKQLTEAGLWYATAPEEDLIELMRQEPGLMRDWTKNTETACKR